MKQKHVDASREVRMWIGTIIVPITVAIMTNPELQYGIKRKCGDFKYSIKNKFHKKES